MTHMDLIAAVAGILITVAAVVLGAWLDLRSGGGERKAEEGSPRAPAPSSAAGRPSPRPSRKVARAGRSEPGRRATAR